MNFIYWGFEGGTPSQVCKFSLKSKQILPSMLQMLQPLCMYIKFILNFV